ncbi:hypothetical protein [Halomicrococcus gelatinilyticus]|uniref:hypothetical protein n=1 Tax=Halomicrococcus gelatinilyticus TaxID=1702103 RepID=UPI002E165432
MSQTDGPVTWGSTHEFEASLEALLTAADDETTVDRAWTCRYDDRPDLMVEITRLAGESDGTNDDCGPELDEGAFEPALRALLRQAHSVGVTFDRSWTICGAADHDLMVEVTRLAPSTSS